MQSIARRADVAPGTVRYHYPDPGAVDAATPVADRIATMTTEMFRVYASTDLDYRAWLHSRDHPVMRTYERRYDDLFPAALAAALGDLATVPHVFQVVSALIDPGFRASLVMRGRSHSAALCSIPTPR